MLESIGIAQQLGAPLSSLLGYVAKNLRLTLTCKRLHTQSITQVLTVLSGSAILPMSTKEEYPHIFSLLYFFFFLFLLDPNQL